MQTGAELLKSSSRVREGAIFDDPHKIGFAIHKSYQALKTG